LGYQESIADTHWRMILEKEEPTKIFIDENIIIMQKQIGLMTIKAARALGVKSIEIELV
jgi:hypothetical protein